MRHVFLINPHAGKQDQTARIRALADRLAAAHNLDCRCLLTDRPGAAESLARALAETGEPLRLYVCGGDGTLHEAANGIAGFVQFNMLFTLLLCFLVLLVQEKVHDRVLRGVCIVLLICASLFCDWALLAPIFTLLFSWAKDTPARKKAAFAAAALLYGGMAGLGSGSLADALGCAVPVLVSGFVILYLYNGKRAVRGRTFYKWFFYAFYPTHLLILGLLRLLA